MVDYIVFFGLLGFSIVLFILHQIRLKKNPLSAPHIDYEYVKCESPIERRLYEALKISGYYMKTQYVVPPARYRIDIALPQYKIAIECDGKAYHSTPAQKARDRQKDAYLRSKGWKVLRFSGSMINGSLADVIKRIEEEINA
jgi:very-short-patch-repair endonuclease